MMTTAARRQALQAAGLVHPHPALVTAALFDGTRPFFLADDKVQVKYEMLRAHAVDGRTASAAAADHGYSRAAFYLIADAFAERGMLGLLDERPGGRWPLRAVRAGRAHHPPHSRADLHRHAARRTPASVDTTRRPTRGRAGRRLPVHPDRHRRSCDRQGGEPVNVAIYARVSTERQHDRGTIGSQLAALRQRAAAEGDEVVAEFTDDGYSGARLDRPGLDGLRDAAEAGLVQAVWCLSPDRLSRSYAYQVIVLDELARHGVT